MTTTSISKRISSAAAAATTEQQMAKAVSTTSSSSQGSSVICEEVFDEACFPSSEEINEYASLIGIEPQREQHLLYLAKEGLMAALPLDWKICYSEEKNGHYYHNTRTKESQWDHPLDAIYRDLVNQARRQKLCESQSGVGDTSDDLSQLDSGIRSMQGIDEMILPSPGPLPLNNLARKWPNLLSGGKSRFLDSKDPKDSKDFGRFYQLGFEVGKSKANTTNPNAQMNGKLESSEENSGGVGAKISLFQKATTTRRQLESRSNSDGYTSPSGVKGILRDSSITDISRRLDRMEPAIESLEDKKSVRFNLDQKSAPENENLEDDDDDDDEGDVEVVVEDDPDDEEDEDLIDKEQPVDLWHETEANLMEGIYSLNPFLLDPQKSSENKAKIVEPTTAATKTKDCEATKLFYDDTDSDSKGSSVRSFIINKSEQDSSALLTGNNAFDLDELGRKHSYELEQLHLKSGKPVMSAESDFDSIRRDHEAKLKRFRHEYDLRLTSHQHKLEEAFELQMEKYRGQLERQLQSKRNLLVGEHKARIDTLQSSHEEILRDMERELHAEEELLRREQATRLSQLRDKYARELEAEKKREKNGGEEARLYEKLRCEKRLLEDKYRCLKEKYVRLKTDVKLSLERRNRRREAQMVPSHSHKSASGNEMERSLERYYQKPQQQSGNSDNRSLSYSDQAIAGEAVVVKPPVPQKNHQLTSKTSTSTSYNIRQLQLQLQQQDDNTSISQSDTTLSNTYNNGRYGQFLKSASGGISTRTVSDNGNAMAMQSNLERNNNGGSGNQAASKESSLSRIVFSRTKSASTSRLNSDTTSYASKGAATERPCTPVENLRHQLQKLEALEDQFPENTLDAPYHLRYPFTDSISAHLKPNGVGSELEFFKHRIHLERDSVRRAKESLRTQRTNFRLRQREIGQQRKITALSPKPSIDQLIQEEKELTEMEVNLHRTRSLLGEKIIRLRHLEQSLLRIYEKEKSMLDLVPGTMDDAATLSDLSSHSSSGFSSTELASAADFHKQKKDYYQQESNECIENLEILNAEIREILDIFGQKQQQQQQQQHELSAWSQVLKQHDLLEGTNSSSAVHIPHSIPTLADRLETYRQLAAGRMQSSMGAAILTANTIVSQSPRAVNYTTCLVERTRDLRNWLRQAKNEHDFLMQHGITSGQSSVVGEASINTATTTAAGNSARGAKNDI
ncbi:centrosomal protein of 164 kDa [Drosophila takahashii]|uniref:centrosomal protein of 164 kDa n=1 Tax=Drosophila takahashii TaxID=29030 RepID=UPI001CF8FC7F|nr:centrosomal protein of 164 kDa [Drosophila takahashii]XP_044249986.1 centrosomal protein of 164 kDa [Drosophila takahashii]XP_044249988.1 centrosomal protein of 164 kDa [Drosophila takahashii]